MAKDELRRMALCNLADYDARTSGELFSRSVDLTIPRSYEKWVRKRCHQFFLGDRHGERGEVQFTVKND
jgi:hypothetical protein